MITRLEQVTALDGITPAEAQQLVDLGLDTYWEIHRLKAGTLTDNFNAAVTPNATVAEIDIERAVRWQKSALRMSLGCVLDLVVHSLQGMRPLAGAHVTAGDTEGVTAPDGTLRLWGVTPAVTRLLVSCAGHYDHTISVDLRSADTFTFSVTLATSSNGARHPVVVSEYDGQFITVTAQDTVRARSRTVAELPNGALLQVAVIDAESARLVSLMRVREGRTIHTDRVSIPLAELPAGSTVGDLLEVLSGALHRSTLSMPAYQEAQAARRFGGGTAEGTLIALTISEEDAKRIRGDIDLSDASFSSLSAEQQLAVRQLHADNAGTLPLNDFLTILGKPAIIPQ